MVDLALYSDQTNSENEMCQPNPFFEIKPIHLSNKDTSIYALTYKLQGITRTCNIVIMMHK